MYFDSLIIFANFPMSLFSIPYTGKIELSLMKAFFLDDDFLYLFIDDLLNFVRD